MVTKTKERPKIRDSNLTILVTARNLIQFFCYSPGFNFDNLCYSEDSNSKFFFTARILTIFFSPGPATELGLKSVLYKKDEPVANGTAGIQENL